MAKQEKKSIADLIGSRKSTKPSVDEIENITQKIHRSEPAEARSTPKTAPTPRASAAPKVKSRTKKVELAAAVEEKIKRISVNAPVSLYLKAKTKATMADQTLMGYILELMKKDLP